MDIDVKEEVLDDEQDISEETFDYSIVKEEYIIDQRNTIQVERTEIDSDIKTKGNLYKCKICNSEWEKQSWLEEHMIYHSNVRDKEDKDLKCPDCPKTFKYKASLNNHSRTHNKTSLPSSLQCQICNKMMKTNEIMRKHIKMQHSEIFTTKSSIDIHMKCYHDPKPLVCEDCGKTYKTQYRYNYERHVAAHQKTRNQNPEGDIAKIEGALPSCTVCKIVCKSMEDLKEHVETHNDDNRFECEICGMKAKSKNIIQSHMKTIHFKIRNEKNEKDAECPICSKKCTSRYLKYHMVSHSTERPFACDLCDKAFKTKDYLKLHKQHHAPANVIQERCSYCTGIFKTRYTFGEHMRIHHRGLPVHPEGPPFKCTVCRSTFRIFGDLKEHVTIHRRESVKCAICEKIFPYKARIKRHMERVHLKRKNQ